MKIHFHGAAQAATGSQHLPQIAGRSLLLGCGLYQGPLAEACRRSRSPGFDPADDDAAVLRHAHVDQRSSLPSLFKAGFRGETCLPCDVCRAAHFNRGTLPVHFKNLNLAAVLDLTVDHALQVLEAFPAMLSRLRTLQEVGPGCIRVGRPALTLSGGEAQRVRPARELSRRAAGCTLCVLAERSGGMHAADRYKLIETLPRLVDAGALIVGHDPDIIRVADHTIDLASESGAQGGYIIARGTPEDVCAADASSTGQFLRPYVCDP